MPRSPWLLLLMVVAALGPACSKDECDLGESRCEGNVRVVCDYEHSDSSAPKVWKRTACDPKSCALGTSGGRSMAVCVVSATPEPRCAGVVAFCDGQDQVDCVGGLVVGRRPCEGQLMCAEAGMPGKGNLLCALSPIPDPRCGNGQSGASVCSASGGFSCRSGFLVAEITCPTGQACVPGEQLGEIRCAPGP